MDGIGILWSIEGIRFRSQIIYVHMYVCLNMHTFPSCLLREPGIPTAEFVIFNIIL